MKNQWFRLYSELLNDPKAQSLDGDTFKVWINLLCVTSQCDGEIIFDDISFYLRMSDADALHYCKILADKGLLDVTKNGYRPHGWEDRQYKSDGSAERTKKYRERKKQENCDVTKTVTVTPPDTEQIQNRTDTENKKESKTLGSRFALTELPDEWKTFCFEKRPDLNPQDLFAEFRDYWISVPGARGRKIDWFATWRNRVRDKKSNAPNTSKTYVSKTDLALEEYARKYVKSS